MPSSCLRGGYKGDIDAVECLPECWDRLEPPMPAVSSVYVQRGLAFIVLWGSLLGLSWERGCSVGGARSRVGHGLVHSFQLGEIHLDGGFVGVGWAELCSPPHHAVPCAIYLGTRDWSLSWTFLHLCNDPTRL